MAVERKPGEHDQLGRVVAGAQHRGAAEQIALETAHQKAVEQPRHQRVLQVQVHPIWTTSWRTWTWAMAITAEDPTQRRRRARAGKDPMQLQPQGNRVLWRPARGTLARAPQHGEGRRRLDPRPPDHAHADLNHSSVEAALEAISGSGWFTRRKRWRRWPLQPWSVISALW